MIALKLCGGCIGLLDRIERLLINAGSDSVGRLIVKQVLIAAVWRQLPQFLIAMVVLFRCKQDLATSC